MRWLATAIVLAALSAAAPGWGMEPEARMQELRRRLESLRALYTEQHPDVRRLRHQLEKLEARAARKGQPRPGTEPSRSGSDMDVPVE
jgi:Spy/CpxP family protein refolding chaperone